MTRDNTLSRGVIGSLALTLTVGIPLTVVRADTVQPLTRPTATSTGDEARWLERLPPTTQPLPRPIEMAQSDTGSLQEALKLLESRVESGAFESAPSTVEADETQAQEPTEPVQPGEQTEIQVSAPQRPAIPAPPVVPTPPVKPVAPEPIEPVSVPIDAADATPESTPDSPLSTSETPAADLSPVPDTDAEAPPTAPETPRVAPATPSPVPSRDESSEDAGRVPPETALQTTAEPIEPATSIGRWQVQLLAGRSLSRVERDRDDLLRFHGDKITGLTLMISQANPKGLYRLRALDWPSQTEADAWCRRLRATTGLQCMVVRGEERPDPGSASIETPSSPAR